MENAFEKPFQIIAQGFFNFIGEIQNSLISAFACNQKAVDGKIYIADIDAHKLAYADSGIQKEG